MLFGAVVILTKEFVSFENVGIMSDSQAPLLEVGAILSVPLLAKFAIISVKISVTRSSASSGLPFSGIFSPIMEFRPKINPKSSP